MGSATYIGAWWGLKKTDSLFPWKLGTLESPANVTPTYTGLVNTDGCSSGSHSSWHVDDVAPSTGWLINWSNGGTTC
jgi:hypothetical protein